MAKSPESSTTELVTREIALGEFKWRIWSVEGGTDRQEAAVFLDAGRGKSETRPAAGNAPGIYVDAPRLQLRQLQGDNLHNSPRGSVRNACLMRPRLFMSKERERERERERECVKPVDESVVIGNRGGQRRTILLARMGGSAICHSKRTKNESSLLRTSERVCRFVTPEFRRIRKFPPSRIYCKRAERVMFAREAVNSLVRWI